VSVPYNLFYVQQEAEGGISTGQRLLTLEIIIIRYELQDNKHYEAFRFQDGSGVVKDFTPNSDMSYTVFRERMEKEWKEYGAEMYREFVAKESANNAQA